MSVALVNKLLESFEELDNCIAVTKEVLDRKASVPADVVERVDQYSEIVAKQRSLTFQLRKHIDGQDWFQVARHVRLINGLSSMIREDAKAILSGSYEKQPEQPKKGKEEQVLC